MNTRDYQRTVQSATQSFFAGQYAAAKWHCEQLLKMQKKSPEAMFLLAQIAWHEGERLDAIAQLQKYVRLYPKDLTARYLLGDYLNTAGRHREAIKSFERILSRQRDDLRSVAGLANAYENQGDPEKALEII
ncbi:MAG: tetratricopeptide repeat protein, partial [Phycisphaerales bacterium]